MSFITEPGVAVVPEMSGVGGVSGTDETGGTTAAGRDGRPQENHSGLLCLDLLVYLLLYLTVDNICCCMSQSTIYIYCPVARETLLLI